MLAGDLFDSRKVWWRLVLFRLIYLVYGLGHLPSWLKEHRYRLAQARAMFTGGNTPVDPV
jgi:4-amino-4-deoxy-L-arabinose transferase-like glycosyltransferase